MTTTMTIAAVEVDDEMTTTIMTVGDEAGVGTMTRIAIDATGVAMTTTIARGKESRKSERLKGR
jgi:hypothetical protein